MITKKQLTNLIRHEAGMSTLESDYDYETLADKIHEATDSERISYTTLKRALGKITTSPNYEISPRVQESLFKFLGCESWEELEDSYDVFKKKDPQKSIFITKDQTGHIIDNLKAGSTLVIEYGPNRKIEVEYKGNYRFRVMNAWNSQLKHDDEFSANNFIYGKTFQVDDVTREGSHIGRYIANHNHLVKKMTVRTRKS